MKTLSSTDLRATLSAVMDHVNGDHEPIIVTRAKGRPVVTVSLEDWAALDETTFPAGQPCRRNPRSGGCFGATGGICQWSA